MFSIKQKQEFSLRDTAAIESAFNRLPAHWQSNSWLSTNNRYAGDCIQQLSKDLTPGSKLTHKHLSEYIAASTIIHCLDGWAYFGRSISALLVGDHNTARHLGYYAELRASMCLLASQGVGIFDKEHIIVSGSGKCIQFSPHRDANKPDRPKGRGTHSFVWSALNEWADNTNSSNALNQLISAGGQPLSEWLTHYGNMPVLSQTLAKEWLISWGLDISKLVDDRDSRNLASYRPSAISSARPPDVRTTIKAIHKAWSICSPITGNPFGNIDRLLVRAAIIKAFKVVNGHSPKQAKTQFKRRINSILAGVQPNDADRFDWEEFFLNDSQQAFDPLLLAAGKATPKKSVHSLQVIFRALLLLRMASGSSKRLIDTLPIGSITHLNFWFDDIGMDRGLWTQNNKPQFITDLWGDAEFALETLMNNLDQVDSFNTLMTSFSQEATILCSSERIGLWGLGL